MSELTIIQDDREKQPWDFSDYNVNVVIDRLKTGDYTVEGHEDDFSIERKSLDDLASCAYGDRHERFRHEVQRAEELDNFAVYVEAPQWHLYDYKDMAESPHYHSNVHPNSVIGFVENWSDRYDISGFDWTGNPHQAAWEAYTTLKSWSSLGQSTV